MYIKDRKCPKCGENSYYLAEFGFMCAKCGYRSELEAM